MNNNTLNEFSTNESPSLSPSKCPKEILQKEQKSAFHNFFPSESSSNIVSSEKLKISQENSYTEKKEKNIKESQKTKIKRRIVKRIIKKRVGKNNSLLDFDSIIKELFQNKNLKNDLVGIDHPKPLRRGKILGKKILGMKRKKTNEKCSKILNRKENSKIFNYYLIYIFLFIKFS